MHNRHLAILVTLQIFIVTGNNERVSAQTATAEKFAAAAASAISASKRGPLYEYRDPASGHVTVGFTDEVVVEGRSLQALNLTASAVNGDETINLTSCIDTSKSFPVPRKRLKRWDRDCNGNQTDGIFPAAFAELESMTTTTAKINVVSSDGKLVGVTLPIEVLGRNPEKLTANTKLLITPSVAALAKQHATKPNSKIDLSPKGLQILSAGNNLKAFNLNGIKF